MKVNDQPSLRCNSINIVEIQRLDLVQLAEVTEWLTGSEIENAFVEALYVAFASGGEAGEKEPTDPTIAGVLTEFVPLSKLTAYPMICGTRPYAKTVFQQMGCL